MNCANHPEIPAIAYCRDCGKPLCENCRRLADGTVYCSEHALVAAAGPTASPYSAPAAAAVPDTSASPALAFLLGLIPGVGAIYNGQYVKGLIHVVIFGILIGIVHSDEAAGGLEPLFGLMIAAWYFYMPFEAYHTAKKRRVGQQVDEFSSFMGVRRRRSAFPAGPAVLIAIGILFLLNNLDILRIHQLFRYWPIALIAIGVYKLFERLSPPPDRTGRAPESVAQETMHEPR